MRILTLLLLPLATSAFACEGLDVSSAWIREAPPGVPVTAGYAILRNGSAVPRIVDAVSSPDFGAAEIHRTEVDEHGVTRMLRDQRIAVPPGKSAELAPGGLHLMLFRPARELRAGDRATITLHCGGAARSFPFTVSRELP